jgi:hypothetical protein
MGPDDYPSPDLNTHVWTLVGANEDKDGIPVHLVVHDTKHLVIFSSPKLDR